VVNPNLLLVPKDHRSPPSPADLPPLDTTFLLWSVVLGIVIGLGIGALL
jgi:hypothetical protein